MPLLGDANRNATIFQLFCGGGSSTLEASLLFAPPFLAFCAEVEDERRRIICAKCYLTTKRTSVKAEKVCGLPLNLNSILKSGVFLAANPSR